VTVLTPGTTGALTGVPVTAVLDPAPSGPIPSGSADSAVQLPVVEPPAGAWSLVSPVSGLAAGGGRETTTSPERRSVALRSDILFPFGKATLTAKAKTLIGETAREIMSSADPGRPITVIGHTDAIGTDADNQTLSERRARAVVAQLRSGLGGAWQMRASGRGETAPLVAEQKPDGSDNAEGRARNRRVEVSYPLLAASTTSTASAGPVPDSEGGAPAPFAAGDGPVVAERDGTSDSRSDSAGPVRFHLTVHPFRRDGRYLVAVFDLANSSGGKLDTSWGYFRSAGYPGPSYASFGVIDPATGVTYRTAYVTVDGVPRYLDSRPHSLTSEEPQRAYVYVPAPPPAVTTVTFDAGPFGRIDNVPVH
jgi:outer membrane protein OmpA-like peptidoglycan-associated protein